MEGKIRKEEDIGKEDEGKERGNASVNPRRVGLCQGEKLSTRQESSFGEKGDQNLLKK